MADYQTEKQNQGSQSGNPQKPQQQTPAQHPQPVKKDVQTDNQQQREKTGTNR